MAKLVTVSRITDSTAFLSKPKYYRTDFFKEILRHLVWICRDPKIFHYYHFIILIAVSIQIFP